MTITNLYRAPVRIMTEEVVGKLPIFLWLEPGETYHMGHDGVAIPGSGVVYKSRGKQVCGVFIGFSTTVHADGRVTGLWTYPLRDPRFFERHSWWHELRDVAEGR